MPEKEEIDETSLGGVPQLNSSPSKWINREETQTINERGINTDNKETRLNI